MDRLYDFRSRSGARLDHPSRYNRLEVANQPPKQAIRNQRLPSQASVCFTIPIAMLVQYLRFNDTENKCRIWIPAFMHLVFYLDFIRHGRDNIGIVTTIAMEELWITLALISASTPTLMRVAKRFTTTGVVLGTTYGSSKSGSKTKELTHQLANFSKNRPVARASQIASPGDEILRPAQGLNTISIDAAKETGEGASVGSTAESHVGILRQIDFDVSSETK
jgi:hypothetical protein